MLEQVAKKTLIISIILILLAAIISISLLSFNNLAFAEEEELSTLMVHADNSYTLSSKNVNIDFSEVGNTNWYGVRVFIGATVETVTFNYANIKNSQIVVLERTTDLTINFKGTIITGYDQETVFRNDSTKGTVHLVNIGSGTVTFNGKKRGSGHMEDGNDITGIVVSRGNISFEGGAFAINGGTVQLATIFGNTDFGATGLQVFGAKDVYFKANVTITGGDGARAVSVGSLNPDGGHGGYAFDGSNAQIIIGDAGYLTLKGGNGGNGASQFGNSGTAGGAGKGCAAYKNSIHVNDTSKFEYEAGEDGQPGFRR